MALSAAQRRIYELTTAFWSGVLKDQDGAVIPSAALSALKLTHMVKDPQTTPFTLINTRDHQDVHNANNVTVDSAGLVTWEMLPADNAIIGAGIVHAGEENHISILEFEWNAGARAGKHIIETTIIQLERMPS